MQIKCPHCNQIFSFDDTDSAAILSQIRDHAFEEELEKRVKETTLTLKKQHEMETQLAIKTACESIEKDKNDCMLELERVKNQAESNLSKERDALKADYEAKLKEKQVEVDYYKDLKAKMSTKMIGETLEQHCETEFNKIRMAAFPKAQFGKDNTVSKESGSKGDYIFREYDENGVEIISIMFEMKNEMETTATKHKNEHFFKELDKDRNEKKCEYAVLVSMLESDSDYYNQGIVDVSYEYQKMYVIRPQFFIPLITLLRNAALTSLDSKKELVKMQQANLDVSNFKENFDTFKKGFSYNYVQAHKRLDEAVTEIDKAIARLQAVKDALTASDKQISQANKKADEITIEKLCKNAPSIKKEFEKLEG